MLKWPCLIWIFYGSTPLTDFYEWPGVIKQQKTNLDYRKHIIHIIQGIPNHLAFQGNCLLFLIGWRIIGITHSSCLTVVLKLKLCVIAFLVSYLYWQNYSRECYENTFLLSISGVNLLWPSREMRPMQMGGGSVVTRGTAGLLFPSGKGHCLRPVGYSWSPSSSLFIAGH